MKLPKKCPIENTLQHIGKKWMINIIRDLFMGKKRFRDFLASNPEISTKMLSTRLKELEEQKFIEKRVVSTTPLIAEYFLTKKGVKLGDILYELSRYSFENCTKEVCDQKEKKQMIKLASDLFKQKARN